MSERTYDLIVLGSGPAGEKGAAQAAYFGKKVAIVERDSLLGGAAARTAIPSKTLRETSLALSGIRSHSRFHSCARASLRSSSCRVHRRRRSMLCQLGHRVLGGSRTTDVGGHATAPTTPGAGSQRLRRKGPSQGDC